jgi:hypothetical protein
VNARRAPGKRAIANPEDFHDFFTTASHLRPIFASMETREATPAPNTSAPSVRPWAWIVFTTVLVCAVFLQAVTAGRILTGDEWARDVHRTVGAILFLVAVGGGAVALVRLRGRTGSRRFGLMLVAIGVVLFVQHRLGTAATDGDNTLWIHVPLGVALLGLLVETIHLACGVGRPT